MPKVFNLHGDDWDRSEDRPGWRSKDAWVGERIGAELIGGSLYELEPGDRLFPYHTHHANEEWLLVVRGRPTLRTPEGEHDLSEGDVVAFPRGEAGLHQVRNRTEQPVRVLMLSTLLMPEVVEYADSRKLGLRNAKGERITITRPGERLDYWDGED
ncbi:MAG TPA: cupin domain-containing protein [Solirubrobacteraceae bacterium]|nr:cupin domain-containing protein [Solirubrobacteraceae bacterium]